MKEGSKQDEKRYYSIHKKHKHIQRDIFIQIVNRHIIIIPVVLIVHQ